MKITRLKKKFKINFPFEDFNPEKRLVFGVDFPLIIIYPVLILFIQILFSKRFSANKFFLAASPLGAISRYEQPKLASARYPHV